jgi:hypothetical protein
LANIHILTKDQFGNYVIQHILEHSKSAAPTVPNTDDKNKIVKSVKGKILELSNHKFASNVVEKCLEYGSEKDRKDIIDEIMEVSGGSGGPDKSDDPFTSSTAEKSGASSSGA